MEHRWAVTTATGEFIYGHAEPRDVVPGLSPTQERVVLSRPPIPRTEKYSGDPADPFMVKTPTEIAAWNDARKNEQVDVLLDDLTFSVLRRWIAELHGLTPAQSRQQLKAIVKRIL
jgi:hypothetical protein